MEVTLHLGRPDLGIEEITRPMRHVGPGKYRLEGRELAVAEPWRVRIELLVSDFEKAERRGIRDDRLHFRCASSLRELRGHVVGNR